MSDRLFFALWPDEPLRATLADLVATLSRGSDGRWQRPDQWHVTLEFIGDVPAERLASLNAAAGAVRLSPLSIAFDRLEHWHKPQVLCLVPSRVPDPLADVVNQLRAALSRQGFPPERRPFRPHVTLARKLRSFAAAALDRPLVWSADRLALVRSVTDPAGSRYEPLGWWNCVVEDG
jgi:2'-5' RNA ligase